MFPCGRWLARGEDDGAIERELLPEKITKELIGRDGQIKTQDVKIRDKLKGQLRSKDQMSVHEQVLVNLELCLLSLSTQTGQCLVLISWERKLHQSETNMGSWDSLLGKALDL